jgi:hypothetical protein
MQYILKDKKGRIEEFNFSINSGPHNIGEGRLGCRVNKEVKNKFYEGDMVTVIGRIAGRGEVFWNPIIEVYDRAY